MTPGTLHVVGVGPGDPELITVKAARVIGRAPVVAYVAKQGSSGHAYMAARAYIGAEAEVLRLDYPCTTGIDFHGDDYQGRMRGFYDDAAASVGSRLAAGRDVALLCEGDPFFYGSAMYVFDRLASDYPTQVIPGVMGMAGAWTGARVPMLHGDETLTVLPATLPGEDLSRRLDAGQAAVIMKLGGNLPGVRRAVAEAGLTERAVYVEYATMANERVMPFAAMGAARAPYFSLVLIPGRGGVR